MDKNEYQKIFTAVKTHTGKDVQFIGEAGKDKDKNRPKDKDKDKDKESFR
jgi:Tat protein secretion system quality control protein TatD with DNase activity